MKVYVLQRDNWSDTEACGVFSTKEKAKAWAKAEHEAASKPYGRSYCNSYTIYGWTVDGPEFSDAGEDEYETYRVNEDIC
jgi:hypothetical protein